MKAKKASFAFVIHDTILGIIIVLVVLKKVEK